MPFVSPFANVQVMLLSDREMFPWLTLEPLVYEDPVTGETFTVERNFRTDGASIPIALSLVPVIGPLLSMRYFGGGIWLGFREGVLHDRLRRKDKEGNTLVPAHVAHKIFRGALYDAGYPADLCENYYAAVVAFNSK